MVYSPSVSSASGVTLTGSTVEYNTTQLQFNYVLNTVCILIGQLAVAMEWCASHVPGGIFVTLITLPTVLYS